MRKRIMPSAKLRKRIVEKPCEQLIPKIDCTEKK